MRNLTAALHVRPVLTENAGAVESEHDISLCAHPKESVISLATIPTAITALQAGRAVIVVDDHDREDEGDIVIAAQFATPALIAWTVRNSSGFICAPMTNERADALALPPMVAVNEDPRGTAYTVSVDAANRLSTGISAADRAHTLKLLADPASTPASLHRPGHIMPIRADDGGVRSRDGHTEAAVDLLVAAGLTPVAAIAEVVADDGDMMRLEALLELGAREDVPVISIEALTAWLNDHEFAHTGGHHAQGN